MAEQTNHEPKKARIRRFRESAKGVVNGIVGAGMIYGFFIQLNGILPNPQIESYVKANFDKVEQTVQEVTCLDIKFNPFVEYGLPKEKNITYNLFHRPTTQGVYLTEEDKIYLNSPILTTESGTVRNIFGMLIGGQKSNALSVLAHEETHSYLENLAQQEGVELGMLLNDVGSDKWQGIQYVEEGIAGYVENKFKGKQTDPFVASRQKLFPSKYDLEEKAKISYEKDETDLFESIDPYKIGLDLVSPIIDAYGEEGIRYLVTNPPKDEELADLKAYQQNALNILSGYAPRFECPLKGN